MNILIAVGAFLAGAFLYGLGSALLVSWMGGSMKSELRSGSSAEFPGVGPTVFDDRHLDDMNWLRDNMGRFVTGPNMTGNGER